MAVWYKRQRNIPERPWFKDGAVLQVFDYLDGKAGLEETSERIKQETRHFAKRQLTWFRREKDVIWLERDPDEADPDRRILERMLEVLRTKEILSE